MPPARTLLPDRLREGLGEWWPRLRPWVYAAVGTALIVAIGIALRRSLRMVRYHDIMAAVSATPDPAIAAAIVATLASYAALTEYDASALRHVGAKVARPTVLLTSFVAYALSNTIGLGPLSGGAVRMRLYAAAGIEPALVARVIAFNTAAFSLGMLVFGAFGLLWGGTAIAPLLHVPAWLPRVSALLMLAALAGFLWLCARRRVLAFGLLGRAWSMRLPTLREALRQLVISACELGASGLALWFLLPHGDLALPTFMCVYAVAVTASLISHVPGGVGVFEAVMLLAAGTGVPHDTMLGALLLYRGVYYVLPLVLAAGVLVTYELRSGVAAPVGRLAVHQSPRLMAALALVAGVWLIVSGVTPFTEDARDVLAAFHVPLPIIEASHLLGSIAGLGLLLVARGLLHQLDAAWWAALVLSIVAGVLALPKGIALNEAVLLLTLALLLVISRRQFDRRSSLFDQHLEPEWLMALGGVLAAAAWILFFAYREVAYSSHLWWQFELDGQAPRSLRALMGVALAAGAFGLWQLMRPPAGELAEASPGDLERAGRIALAHSSSDACYVLMGDKHLLFSASGRSFLMYGKQGRSWVSLFGPFGDAHEFADLVWQFIELASDHGGRAAFYQVRPTDLPLYLDCGLHVLKLGEHAHVRLPEFSLKGGKRANLRSGVNRGEREGLTFDVVDPPGVAAWLPTLREISDAWLAEQRGREKGYSVGRFDADYLQRLPIALVRRGDEVLAFANLLATDAKEEASIDLMRYRPGAPPGTMDFLFAKIMLHLQAAGYERFGLGMSPMAGMAERRKAPRWQRLGRLLYDYGDRYYNFRGLHSFKDKFEPVWEARYLASAGGLTPVLVLADVATLIGGGVKGVLAK
ncbi:MAG: bifunctional lysylphosphatidylglycerol flippase/synthetase MprF [Proteobacteria bacterium]|nr:bifunctional lysylphosphatidylglycerol flippase/synthetase MprF [Pseudomonadota bacterium]